MTEGVQLMVTNFLRVVLIIPFLAQPLAASEGGNNGDRGGEGTGLQNRTTRDIVKTLTFEFERCHREKKIYRWDCYRKTYRLVVNKLNGRLSYSHAQDALEHVEEELDQIVAEYQDPAVPKKRRLTRSYVAIKPEAIPAARARTERAMEEAQTMLLRAPSHTQSHYVRIADAINSNKVLLRSALLMLPNRLIRLAQIFAKSTNLQL
ncbi:hypothetical protein EBB79_16655 [Parasedimentitalea marina]|uniref:Uncharacterized protein n=2 Tax=Parasedimentitalea marina TaxID=2483033 RepID=A0A3T0N5S5_9RHOB|nr:hypothetical protein EBB79_16655 [Parasedimentitalea marina]